MTSSSSTNSMLFREYIGAMYNGVKFTDIPINPNVNFHFILSFAIDYTHSSPPIFTDGKFNIHWDSETLGPSEVSSIKKNHPNVKVAMSLGGATVGENPAKPVVFKPSSTKAWVDNAVYTLTKIIKKFNLDGIDINYEHFNSDPDIFAECIGLLLKSLKDSKVISFASIAPFNNEKGERYYMALWNKYAELIDYVNFQFYSYDKKTSETEFLEYYRKQAKNYKGGKILTSFLSKGKGGLTPKRGFFSACRELKSKGELHGIFIWCADDSKKKKNGFSYEKDSQELLAS